MECNKHGRKKFAKEYDVKCVMRSLNYKMSIKIDDDDYNDDEKSSKEEEGKENDTEQCLLLLEKYSTRTLATSAAQII